MRKGKNLPQVHPVGHLAPAGGEKETGRKPYRSPLPASGDEGNGEGQFYPQPTISSVHFWFSQSDLVW